MLKVPATMAEIVDTGEYRSVLGHFASGVVILTGLHAGRPAGMTCQSFFSLSLDPPLIAVAAARTSTSWPKIASTGKFSVNILASGQEQLARTFAQSGADKFSGVGWHRTGHGSAHLDEALAWIDCEIDTITDGGDHLLVTARVRALQRSSGNPLLYYRGTFSSLGS